MEMSLLVVMLSVVILVLLMLPKRASAHCDTMDGPTVADGRKALETGNVNHVLKWVMHEYEKEVIEKFELCMKVKDLSVEAKQLAEQYFFSELVRIHRAGEGEAFDGLKPSGTPIDEKVLAADRCIEMESLAPLEGLIEEVKMKELEERFKEVMVRRNFDVDDVDAGRRYIEAYVHFFKFAEGEEHGHHEHHGTQEHVHDH